VPARQILEESVQAGAFPGAVVVAGDERMRMQARQGAAIKIDRHVIFEVTAGRFEFDPTSTEVRSDTIYDVASLTKVVVTTTLAMMLFEEGKLDLDAQVDGYTIRQLLTHSSGLPAQLPLPLGEGRVRVSRHERLRMQARQGAAIKNFEPDCDPHPALRVALSQGERVKPGTKVIYSDVGFIVLGQIIEDLAGKKLDVLARERIFEPLGMRDTSFNPDPSLLPRIAPTGKSTRGSVHDPTAAAMGGVAGHAGLFSTALDLAIFCRTMLRPDKTIELFTRVDERVAGSTRALGWDTPLGENSAAGRYFSKGSFGHTGFTGTSMWIDPNRKLYVIFLTNRVFPNSANIQIRDIRPKLHDAVMSSLIPVDVTK
jgi:CubicO group peptidase (beta-lactamase class C family)